MDEATKQSIIKQLQEAEQYVEKVKAELYSTVGKIATLKDLLKSDESNTNVKKEQV